MRALWDSQWLSRSRSWVSLKPTSRTRSAADCAETVDAGGGTLWAPAQRAAVASSRVQAGRLDAAMAVLILSIRFSKSVSQLFPSRGIGSEDCMTAGTEYPTCYTSVILR